jgi:hypothetical protein
LNSERVAVPTPRNEGATKALHKKTGANALDSLASFPARHTKSGFAEFEYVNADSHPMVLVVGAPKAVGTRPFSTVANPVQSQAL